jgi:hypothetical protein
MSDCAVQCRAAILLRLTGGQPNRPPASLGSLQALAMLALFPCACGGFVLRNGGRGAWHISGALQKA